jgi:hypothetical protein
LSRQSVTSPFCDWFMYWEYEMGISFDEVIQQMQGHEDDPAFLARGRLSCVSEGPFVLYSFIACQYELKERTAPVIPGVKFPLLPPVHVLAAAVIDVRSYAEVTGSSSRPGTLTLTMDLLRVVQRPKFSLQQPRIFMDLSFDNEAATVELYKEGKFLRGVGSDVAGSGGSAIYSLSFDRTGP